MHRKLEKSAKNYIGFILIFLIKISKAIFAMPDGTCKYVPTCSEYAKQVIEKYNFTIAIVKIIIRVLKCNPFSKGGIDPA